VHLQPAGTEQQECREDGEVIIEHRQSPNASVNKARYNN